jgi:hypothetical protein
MTFRQAKVDAVAPQVDDDGLVGTLDVEACIRERDRAASYVRTTGRDSSQAANAI